MTPQSRLTLAAAQPGPTTSSSPAKVQPWDPQRVTAKIEPQPQKSFICNKIKLAADPNEPNEPNPMRPLSQANPKPIYQFIENNHQIWVRSFIL
jgi:hypothetical protein